MDLQELFIQFAAEFVKRTKGEDIEATEEDVNSLIEMLGPDQDTIEQNLIKTLNPILNSQKI